MRRFIRKILLWLNVVLALSLGISYLANYINPAYVWPIAFLGLAYPFLLVLNILFMVFWGCIGKWYALISLVIILIGWSYIGRFVQIRVKGRSEDIKADIRLLSYNVRMFNKYLWEGEIDAGDSILYYASDKGADILCFQEYLTFETPGKFDKTSLDSFKRTYLCKHEYFTSNVGPAGSTGIVTYSQLPIVKKGSLHFDHSFNSCIYSDVIYKTDTIRIFNLHLQSIHLKRNRYSIIDDPVNKIDQKRISELKDISERLKTAFIKRARQVDEVSRLICQSPYPVIVCGDFNDTPLSYTYQKIRGNLQDAFIDCGSGLSNTYHGSFPSFRIDFIFYSPVFKASGYQCDRVSYSDHYPVNCQLVKE